MIMDANNGITEERAKSKCGRKKKALSGTYGIHTLGTVWRDTGHDEDERRKNFLKKVAKVHT